MKREIRCEECFRGRSVAPHWQDQDVKTEYRRGLLLHDCRCDWCNMELKKDNVAYAMTQHRGDYLPWEMEYLREEK